MPVTSESSEDSSLVANGKPLPCTAIFALRRKQDRYDTALFGFRGAYLHFLQVWARAHNYPPAFQDRFVSPYSLHTSAC